MNNHLSTDLLVDFIHGELPPQDDALAHAHIATCAACRSELDLELSLGEALRAAVASEEREMPSLVAAAVWQQIREAQPGPIARLAAFLRPAVAVPAAAVILLAGGWFASPYAHRPNAATRTVNAAYYFEAHAAQAADTPLSERTMPQVLETSALDEVHPAVVLQANFAYAPSGTLDAVR